MTSERERLMELLTDRALVGLGAREQIELAELLVKVQDVDPGAFDKAAAAIALAAIGPLEAMPSALAARIEQSAMKATDFRTSRPASDFASTREIDKLSPGFARTQVEVEESTALAEAKVSREHQKTVTMDDRPAPPDDGPASFPTLVRPNDPYPRSSSGDLRALAPPPVAPAPRHGSSPAFTPAPLIGLPPPPPSNVVPFSSARVHAPVSAPSPSSSSSPSPSRAVAISGWLAAAACLLLAIGAFAIRPTSGPVATLPQPATLPSPMTPPSSTLALPSSGTGTTSASATTQTPADLRERLLAAEGTARADWSATKDPAGKAATGEVVWNKDQQKGVMRFRGLAKNDPSRAQYQLWIFDKTRDEKYPVDGGVFDVDSETGDVIVAIRATLPVNAPQLFAVTLEKPGGVVVSKRDRIVVTAKLPAG